jgi:hypothetical protein
MKNIYLRTSGDTMKKMLIYLMFLMLVAVGFGAPFTSTQAGNWDVGTTWGGGAGQVEGKDYPGAGDTASTGHAVDLNLATANATTITFTGALGTLTCNASETINADIVHTGSALAGIQQAGTGTVTINGDCSSTAAASTSIITSTSTSGGIVINGSVTPDADGGTTDHGIYYNATAVAFTITINGDLTGGTGTSTASNGIYLGDPGGNVTITISGVLSGGVGSNNTGIRSLGDYTLDVGTIAYIAGNSTPLQNYTPTLTVSKIEVDGTVITGGGYRDRYR